MLGSAGHLHTDGVVALCEYRTFNEETEAFGAWTALGSDGEVNNAAAGDQVRVTLHYSHELLTGLFPGMTDGAGTDTLSLDASTTMRRE